MDAWTIYRNPKDFQGSLVARRFVIGSKKGEPEPTSEAFVVASDQIETLRDEMRQRGLTRFERAPSDDPAIVETWL